MIDIDLQTLQQPGKKSWPIDLREAAVGRQGEHQPKTDETGRHGDNDPGEASDPTIIGKSANVGIMRLKLEEISESERPEAFRPFEQHGKRADLVAESSGRAFIIGLRDRRPFKEKFSDRGLGEKSEK